MTGSELGDRADGAWLILVGVLGTFAIARKQAKVRPEFQKYLKYLPYVRCCGVILIVVGVLEVFGMLPFH